MGLRTWREPRPPTATARLPIQAFLRLSDGKKKTAAAVGGGEACCGRLLRIACGYTYINQPAFDRKGFFSRWSKIYKLPVFCGGPNRFPIERYRTSSPDEVQDV